MIPDIVERKASDIIEAALESKYVYSIHDHQPLESAFMCTAIGYYLDTLPEFEGECTSQGPTASRVTSAFMAHFGRYNVSTLMCYMRKTSKVYRAVVCPDGGLDGHAYHYSMEAYKMRVKWWRKHIRDLRKKGL